VLLQAGFGTPVPSVSKNLGHLPVGLCVSPQGRLFVGDSYNNRILWFDHAAVRPNGADADGVLGITNFTTRGYTDQYLGSLGGSSYCTLDEFGCLWAGDAGAISRVIRFAPLPETFPEWQILHFGIEATQAGQKDLDPDQDGLSNLMEYALDTDPMNSDSSLALVPDYFYAGRPHMHFSLSPYPRDLKVSLQYTPGLQPGSWTTLCERTGQADWAGVQLPEPDQSLVHVLWKFTDVASPNPRAFYRLQAELVP
jgi:hypothetical protein